MIGRATDIRFECQPGCTNCCDQQGFVYLTEDDIARLAAFVGMKQDAFEKQYVFRTRNLRRLRVPRHAQCWFLKDGGCSVHPAKPVQCRAFPFWPELMKSARAWKSAGKYCPGIGKGPLVNIELAAKTATEMRQAHPALYDR
ncbi:MAG: YkgJ family cysteine cluster protein [Acidobacteriota bacterium]|nr:YkgJ family cysteine cluster protein [Acidobacteriota bacterium]